ncbi:MAG: 30S ribosomal protein S3, partial [Fidelibacterota bacterium]
SDIDFAVTEARTTYGTIGIKVWICNGELPT